MKTISTSVTILLCLLFCSNSITAQCDDAPAAQLSVNSTCMPVAFNRTINTDYWDYSPLYGNCEEDDYYDAYTWFDAVSNSTTISYTSTSDAILTLFSNACNFNMIPASCTNNFGAGGTESFTYATTPGHRYHIRIQNYYSNVPMTGTICLVDANLASLTTAPVGTFNSTSATLGGNISAQGAAAVTERGIVYNTSSKPTTANTKVAMGAGTGAYSASVTGLTPNTIYYVRSYAITTTGTAYGSEQNFTTAAALPLRLLSFAGTPVQAGMLLQWKTSSEYDLSRFELQRSADGRNFIFVENIAATNTTAAHNYSYTDRTAINGTVYYRLKQIDINGRFTYSAVLSFTIDQQETALSLYPNPFTANPVLSIRMQQADQPTFTITDNAGRTVKQWQQEMAAGTIAITIPMDGFATGVYFLQVKGKTVSRYVKLVKN
jgi:hypothetical protein